MPEMCLTCASAMMNVIGLARIKLLAHFLFVKFSLLGHKLKWPRIYFGQQTNKYCPVSSRLHPPSFSHCSSLLPGYQLASSSSRLGHRHRTDSHDSLLSFVALKLSSCSHRRVQLPQPQQRQLPPAPQSKTALLARSQMELEQLEPLLALVL